MFPAELLRDSAKPFGIDLDTAQTERFHLFTNLLLEWNGRMNLTAITDIQEIVIRHYVDSLLLPAYAALPPGGRMIDVGSGAGFPGIPLKIYRPDIHVTLLDSQFKRISFLNAASEALGLELETVNLRAEQAGRSPELRESFDLAAARAVAGLPVLCELCLPFVKPGGLFAAMKGPKAKEELAVSNRAISELGGEIWEIKEVTLPDNSGRTLIFIKKRTQTPTIYPRRDAKIQKSPL